ncbi:MAG: hypothetical protein DRJ08_02655 [Acidobacteria bacterium]|nr:MAG: hypothetical protein DRJ08_02655 [Acidobacteriota bacterium]
MEKTAFLPGESGTIKAYFNTAHYNGSVTKTIQVYSNTYGGGNIVRLRLKATVVTDLKPARTSIYFRNVVPGKSYTERVFIENNMHKPLEIKGHSIVGNVNASRNFPLKVGLVRSKDGKEYVSVTLKALKNMPVLERRSFTLSLETNSTKMPKMNLFIIIKMQKPVLVTPISLFMFGNHQGVKRVRRIQLTSNTGNPLEIVSIHSKAKIFTFETVREDEKTIDIWIGIRKDASLGVFNDIIQIVAKEGKTDHKFSIPARGSVIK